MRMDVRCGNHFLFPVESNGSYIAHLSKKESHQSPQWLFMQSLRRYSTTLIWMLIVNKPLTWYIYSTSTWKSTKNFMYNFQQRRSTFFIHPPATPNPAFPLAPVREVLVTMVLPTRPRSSLAHHKGPSTALVSEALEPLEQRHWRHRSAKSPGDLAFVGFCRLQSVGNFSWQYVPMTSHDIFLELEGLDGQQKNPTVLGSAPTWKREWFGGASASVLPECCWLSHCWGKKKKRVTWARQDRKDLAQGINGCMGCPNPKCHGGAYSALAE